MCFCNAPSCKKDEFRHIYEPLTYWISKLQKKPKKRFQKVCCLGINVAYICTPKTACPLGRPSGPRGHFAAGDFFWKKKSAKDCGKGKRVLYLHPLKAGRAFGEVKESSLTYWIDSVGLHWKRCCPTKRTSHFEYQNHDFLGRLTEQAELRPSLKT